VSGIAGEAITAESIQAQRREAEQATDLDGESKQKVLQAYDQAGVLLEAAAKFAARAIAFQNQIDTVPAETERVERELRELSQTQPAIPPSNESLESLKTGRIEKESALAKAKEELAAAEAEVARRVASGQEIRKTIADAKVRLSKVEEQLRAPFAAGTPAALLRAQTASLLAEKQSLEHAIAAYEKELLAHAATTDLLPLRQRLAASQVTRLEEEAKAWWQEESRMAELETKRKADEARRAAIEADPGLRELATMNKRFAELAESVAAKTRQEVAAQGDIKTELDNVQRQFQRARERVEAVGLTNSIGQLLRTQKTQLPDVEKHYREVQERQATLRSIQMELFDLQDSRSDARGLDQQVGHAIKEAGELPATILPEELESTVRGYLVRREEYRDSAIRNHLECLRAIGESEVLQRQLIQETEAFSKYIGERVLWIQSAQTLSLKEIWLSGKILRSGMSPDGWSGWRNVASAWMDDARKNVAAYSLVFLLLLSWLTARRRVRNSLALLGEKAATSAQVRIWPTIQALLATALAASAGPALAYFLGHRLTLDLEAAPFVRSVGAGMMDTALWWFPLALLSQLCRPHGLAELHFGWPAGGLRSLRRHLHWYAILGTPLLFVISCIEAEGIEKWQNSLGRVAYIALAALSALFAHSVLRLSGATFRHFRTSKTTQWLFRHRGLLHGAAIGTAAILAMVSLFGYYYTAFRLGNRVRETVLLALALAVASALLSRWVLVVRRRLAMERMRQRRAAEASDAAEGEGSVIASMPTGPVDQEIDLTKVTEQTRRFVNNLLLLVGLLMTWWIWIEVMPALAFLDRVSLWDVTTTVSETITSEDGATTVRTIERPSFISLGDLGLAVLILVVTIIAAKNLPGLLELSLPQQLPLDAGARYAITTLTRYGVIAVGVLVGFNTVGVSWSKIQWLVAALTVGLGFGLQEIFANFVSGLILLFERPIRVGDVVTVDDITGVVSRIQTRATTVTNWDRKDFIVPNKEFITGRLLNWTRSDHVNRIVINVGIAYGSDTEKARQLIEQVLREHKEVLDDPRPMVTFEGFGESTLDLVVRCYLAKLDNRLQTIHDLHTAIDQAFRKSHIQIAFPQRDIHIRSGRDLLKRETEEDSHQGAS
jgi:potassium efflux system protein